MDYDELERRQHEKEKQSEENFVAAANAFKAAILSEYFKNVHPVDLIDQIISDYTLPPSCP